MTDMINLEDMHRCIHDNGAAECPVTLYSPIGALLTARGGVEVSIAKQIALLKKNRFLEIMFRENPSYGPYYPEDLLQLIDDAISRYGNTEAAITCVRMCGRDDTVFIEGNMYLTPSSSTASTYTLHGEARAFSTYGSDEAGLDIAGASMF